MLFKARSARRTSHRCKGRHSHRCCGTASFYFCLSAVSWRSQEFNRLQSSGQGGINPPSFAPFTPKPFYGGLLRQLRFTLAERLRLPKRNRTPASPEAERGCGVQRGVREAAAGCARALPQGPSAEQKKTATSSNNDSDRAPVNETRRVSDLRFRWPRRIVFPQRDANIFFIPRGSCMLVLKNPAAVHGWS